MNLLIARLRRLVLAVLPRRWLLAVLPPSLVARRWPQPFYEQQQTCQIPLMWWLFSFFLGERDHGTFVEIGAFDGIYASNTWGLAVRGWHGLYVEAEPGNAQRCRENHARHPHVTVVNSAVGPEGMTSLVLQPRGPLSTAVPAMDADYRAAERPSRARRASRAPSRPTAPPHTVTVPCTTLHQLLVDHAVPTDVDVLVVDVEGFETEVMSTLDLTVWRPKMMIVELTDTHPKLRSLAADHARLHERLCDAGYRVAYKDAINTVYVRADVWQTAYARGT